jgi:hypothetical protein
LAYRFEPDGLQFARLALVVLATNPSADGNLPMLFTVSGENVEAISSLLYTTDPKTRRLIVTAPITHFSDLISTRGLFAVFIKFISDHVQNVPFNVDAQVTRQDPTPIRTWTLTGNWSAQSPIEPRTVSDKPSKLQVPNKELTIRQQFTCKGLSDSARVTYTAAIDFELSVLVKDKTQTLKLDQTLSVLREFMCVRMVQSLIATFANFTTTYTVSATHPDNATLSYTWKNSNPCGEFLKTSNGNVAKWIHPHTAEPGACPEEGIKHPGEITVVVSDGKGATETVVYKDGSAVGSCKFSRTDSEIEGPCTIEP